MANDYVIHETLHVDKLKCFQSHFKSQSIILIFNCSLFKYKSVSFIKQDNHLKNNCFPFQIDIVFILISERETRSEHEKS